jgi:stage V sporulation protein AD
VRLQGGHDDKGRGPDAGGDLQDQITASGFAARALGIPFFGLYGACSTFIESVLLGAALVDAGFAETAVCGASSHFCAAERQYRFPLELGNQRPPSAQWTATPPARRWWPGAKKACAA